MLNMETDLFRHIFVRALITGEIQVRFDGVGATATEIIEGKCYQTLQKIREILDDHTLSDENCFERIEEMFVHLSNWGVTAAVDTILGKRRTTYGRPYILHSA